MTTKRMFFIAAFMLCISAVSAQIDLADKFSKNKDITKVIMSKTLLSMASGTNMNGVNTKAIGDKIDRLEVFSSEKAEGVKLIKAEINKIAKSNLYEVLMSVNEGDENVVSYAQKGTGGFFKDLIIYTAEADECTVVRLVGNFSFEDLQGVIPQK